MHDISKSVVKKDHAEKMDGSALYVGDFPKEEGILYGKLVRAMTPRAAIKEIRYPVLPEGYASVDRRDVPGANAVHIVEDDTPVFAEDTTEFIGETIAMIVGPDEKTVERLAGEVEVVSEELKPVLDIDDSEKVFFDYHYGHGDVEKAFAEADKIYDEKFETGYQEQGYLEPQGMIACQEGGFMTVHGSIQCPYYVHGAIAQCLGIGRDEVRVIQDYTGGGFGGKEAFPSILAAQTAVAAWKTGKKVRVVFERREDMEYTSKRHPSKTHYRVAVKDGRVTAMDIEVRFNAGAYTTLTPVVLQRGIIAAPGVYNVPNVKVHGCALKTNLVPCGAFRGFGAPQTFFAVEMLMSHIAKDLGIEPLDFKKSMLVKQGDLTSTNGRYHYPVPVAAMVEEVEEMSGFKRKRAEYAKPQGGRYLRGIGMALWFHGAGFTGSGERDFIKAVVGIQKYKDGRVEVLAANSDIGQGLKTTFCKIVANELALPLERVEIHNPDTQHVPDSGPTVASRSLMVVGELLRRAAARLKEEWKDGEDQRVEERFVEPDFMLPFHIETFDGDAYPTFSWGVGAIELKIDRLTGENEVVGSWNSFDIGTPIDLNIAVGQMEGGVLQGMGHASMEQMSADARGRIRNNSYSDYILPTSKDLPVLEVKMHVEGYPYGPYGAKGAGELPLVGIPPAFVDAAEQALSGASINHIPLTAEDTLDIISGLGGDSKEAE
ncbi:MAG: molybdopterin-dependent oxidoreductase [Clostridiales Family XIII bacterium]|jgi:CO/xanthine dehydrogenase Mo-binding subunit|nr:molybdopterin-dependent oxidoreductase [Clostridiales Family XIII bacterium]